MMKKTISIISLATVFMGLLSVPVMAVNNPGCHGFDCVNKTIDSTKAKTGANQTVESQAKNITNILIFIVGAVSVIMIVVGGIKYVTSGGETSSVESAKNTILYATVGLVITLVGYAIVNFIITTVG